MGSMEREAVGMGQTEAVDTTPEKPRGFEVRVRVGVRMKEGAVVAGRLVRSFEHLHRDLIVDRTFT